MADSELGINTGVKPALLKSTISSQRGAINPFVPDYKPDSFESTSHVTKSSSPPKKSHIALLKQKVDDFLQLQQFNALANRQEIQNMIVANPKIDGILETAGIKKEICLENLTEIYGSHIKGTRYFASEIAQNLGLNEKDVKTVQKGALFHDFGKVLIPKELLNKPSKLTKQEYHIVSKHAILGYELLRMTNMEPEVLEIIKNHHKYKSNLGNSHGALLSQIVTVADIYSALITERPYKKAMSPNEAFKILDKLCEEDKVDKKVVQALKNIVMNL